MNSSDKIIIKGAREHNLKNIDLELPRNIHGVLFFGDFNTVQILANSSVKWAKTRSLSRVLESTT